MLLLAQLFCLFLLKQFRRKHAVISGRKVDLDLWIN